MIADIVEQVTAALRPVVAAFYRTPAGELAESTAQEVVGIVRAGHQRRNWLSGLALIITLAVAGLYLLGGALRVSPLASTYRVTIELPESGGLLPGQDVAMRGVLIGKVASLDMSGVGVSATVNVDSAVRIPAASTVRVAALSPAGEQYIDFTPRNAAGPYLSDGNVISAEQTATPVPLSQLLADSDGMLAQLDLDKLGTIKRELSLSDAGPGKLTAIIDGGVFLLAALDSVLPQTVSTLKTSRTVFNLAVDVNDGIATGTRNLNAVLAGMAGMESGYRRLLSSTPTAMAAVDNLFVDNSDVMVQLLGNLATTARLSYVRVPALNALFPDYRGSMLESVITAMHDNGLWATADIYPRYTCDYGTPRRPPSSADYPEPFLYTYCRDDDPAVLIRGAKNAPRPAGDDTAGPPPGADLAATADPSPPGRYTVPTPYGGPTLPVEPPR